MSERFIEDYDLFDNPFQAGLDLMIDETKSTQGFVCFLKGNDLSFLTTAKDMYMIYTNSLVEKVVKTKTPQLSKGKVNIPSIGEVSSFLGIPIQNKERLLGVIGLCEGTYTIQDVKKYTHISLIFRLRMEKMDTDPTNMETRTKDLFLANMSHEIRTPLNGVIGYTQLLLQAKASEVQLQYIKNINKCSLNLAQIINDILDFSKLSSGKMKVFTVPTKVQDVVDFVKDTLMPKVAEKQHILIINLPNNLPNYILIDKQKIIQVLMNLLSNAIKFTEPGGKIVISVTTPTTSSISPSPSSRSVKTLSFSVKDNGVGISRENKNRLFRTFSQLDNTLTKSYGGSGLGLAISKKLVELLKGEISFTSSFGVGSEFTFTAKYTELDEGKWTPSEKIKGKSVLIVSNESESRLILSEMFLKWGLKPTPCGTIQEALKLLNSFAYDFEMCITDMNLHDELQENFSLLPVIDFASNSSSDYHIEIGWGYIKIGEIIEKAFRESRYVKKKDSLKVNKDLKILIAEDNLDNQEVLVTMLKNLQYSDITVVVDGVDAVKELQTKVFDVILLDLKMPRMDGFQVLEYLKKTKKTIKVVPITASVLDDDQIKCEQYGAKFFLRKPIELKDLQQALFIG